METGNLSKQKKGKKFQRKEVSLIDVIIVSGEIEFPFSAGDWAVLREFYRGKQRGYSDGEAHDLYWGPAAGKLWAYSFFSVYSRPFEEPREIHLERVAGWRDESVKLPEFEEWVESIALKLKERLEVIAGSVS